MSLETWKKEFYPAAAEESASHGVLAAAKHDLLEWRGAMGDNLDRHGVTRESYMPIVAEGDEQFPLNSDTSALCVLSRNHCPCCPLWKVREEVSCTAARSDEATSPYDAMLNDHDYDAAFPMVGWLEKTVQYLQDVV